MAFGRAFAAFTLLAWAVCVGCAHSSKAQPPPELEGGVLHWLVGCWVAADGTREVWNAAPDGYYFGFSTTTKNGAVVFFEQMRIEAGGAETIFSAYPKGGAPTRFIADDVASTSIRFRNDAHDYPNTIVYRLMQGGIALQAEIASTDGSRSAQWTYKSCDK